MATPTPFAPFVCFACFVVKLRHPSFVIRISSFGFFLSSFCCAVLRAATDAPLDLRVNDLPAPVGTDASPYFGWQLPAASSPDELQSGYQLRVTLPPSPSASSAASIWDSGKVTSRLQNHVAYSGPALSADTRYLWQVRTWDKDGEASPWSPPASFTVGLLADSDWAGAAWIRRDTKDADDYTQYRRALDLPASPVVRATAYVSAVHTYELFVNGVSAGKGHAYQYPQYQYYQARDVTALLRPGRPNQLAVLTHWFGGGQGRPASARGLLLKLVVHHADGTVTTLGTDASWKHTRAPAWLADAPAHRNRGEGVGYIEHIDARLLDPAWTAPGFDDSAWLPATVVGSHPVAPWIGRLAPDLVHLVEQEIAPASITDKGDGKVVVDLGKVHAGIPRIRFSGGTAGEVITMRGGFVLDANGELPAGAKAQDTLLDYRATLSGGDFTYQPVEYLGYRYFQIDRAPMPVTADNFSFIVRHAPLDEEASAFNSSDATLDAVWALMKHSLYTCAMENFVDTPTREKGGFLGDAVIQSCVAMPVLHERALTRRVLHEFLASMEQHWAAPADRGRINAVYPNNDGARDIPDFTKSFLDWVHAYYLETGDLAFLRAHFDRLQEVGDYQLRHLDPATGLVTLLTGGRGPYEFGIIDWPARMRYGHDMTPVARTVINARAYAGFTHLADFAAALDLPAERDLWRARAASLRTAINNRLLAPSGLYHDGLLADGTASPHASQHANMFPLALGLVPETTRAAVLDHVVSQRMSVGMVTVGWLVRALGESGQGPALLDLLTNANQPGWARTLALGGTATWESWDADANTDSMSHAWGAAGLEAYTRYILGIRPLAPQYEQVLIQPLDFGDKLASAQGKITTDRGPISVHWIRTAATYTLHVTIPVNVTARLALPATASATARLNGHPVHALHDGASLIVPALGSGTHTLVIHN